MVLDLDGDGIETTSTRDGTVILFDHDADGVKTGTGWVKPDDGWLVLDRNGNGTIDSGRELFGVDTLKSNGQLATDGFDALKDLDANKDCKIDSADSVFANLRIWRDLNQDGISQANELTTLAANSITGIGVNSSAVRTDLGNGNVQTAAGTFTPSNGTTGTTGEANGAAANLDLLVNTFYRTFTTEITLTDQAKALPDLRGSGRVRDLSEAVSLSTDLGNWVQTYTQQTTRQGQIDKLDGFIEKWANTADLKSLKAQADALTGSGVKLTYNLAGVTAGTPAYDDFVRKLGVVERFMGFTYGGANGQARFTPLDASSGNLTVSLAAEQIASISLAYDRFKTDIYESLVLETRLNSYFNKLDLAVTNGSVTLSYLPLEAAFKQAIATNQRDGIIDLVEFLSAAGETRLKNLNWNATDFLVTQLNAAPDLGAFSEELSSWTVRLAASPEHNLTGTSRPDLIVGSAGDDVLKGADGNDVLVSKGGNDTLDGGAGADTYGFGRGSGKDTITDYEYGGTNQDTIVLSGLNTVDLTATEQCGNDLILKFGDADQITVQNYFDNSNAYRVERFVFADGTVWGDANLKNILVRYGDASANSITGYSDGTNRIYGLDGNDYLYGGALADTLDGGIGDDNLRGNAGADNLLGGAGNDTLSGNADADTLDGGIGNDVLKGGAGNDTYKFAVGSGVDRISDYDTTAGNTDVVTIGAGVAANQMWFRRVGSDLEVSIIGGPDKSTISDWYSGSAYHVEQFKTSDGKMLLDSQVDALVSAMAAFAPPAAGQTTLPADYQTALNPVIAANWK